MLISLPHLALLTLSVFGGATLGTALMRRLAVRYSWMVLPRADRWHKQPTARYGGVGFYPVFLLGATWILGQQYGGGADPAKFEAESATSETHKWVAPDGP